MAYIGPEPNPGQNREVDDISSSFNGSTTAFTLQVASQNVSPGSSNAIIVSLGGVIQNPGTDYTIAASTITFTTAPASGLSFFGLVLGQSIDTEGTADGSIVNASVSSAAAIAGTKISPDFGSQNIATTGSISGAAGSFTSDLDISEDIRHLGDTDTKIKFPAADTITVQTAGSERLRVNSSGNVGLNTNSPVARLHLDTTHYVETNSGRAVSGIHLDGNPGNQHEHGGGISFATGNTGAAAIAATQATSNSNQVALSIFNHQSSNGSDDSVEIARFGFKTASVYIGKVTEEVSVASSNDSFSDGCGVTLAGGNASSYSIFGSNNTTTMYVARRVTDGTLIEFFHDTGNEGNIAVSGSTVSYNGGHLSRWSQLAGISETDKSARPEIYQGTVMSNLDELCVWSHPDVLYTEENKIAGSIPDGKDVGDVKEAAHTEDNQQLNKTKVSDTAGDKDVAGVFWAWDDDDDEYVNDFYIAMTGDMVIRVAASTTVARGDLLISAGDGTAKPQADDIVRSSTIAKIISTNHTATYPDGSKAYPCVLMAC